MPLHSTFNPQFHLSPSRLLFLPFLLLHHVFYYFSISDPVHYGNESEDLKPFPCLPFTSSFSFLWIFPSFEGEKKNFQRRPPSSLPPRPKKNGRKKNFGLGKGRSFPSSSTPERPCRLRGSLPWDNNFFFFLFYYSSISSPFFKSSKGSFSLFPFLRFIFSLSTPPPPHFSFRSSTFFFPLSLRSVNRYLSRFRLR